MQIKSDVTVSSKSTNHVPLVTEPRLGRISWGLATHLIDTGYLLFEQDQNPSSDLSKSSALHLIRSPILLVVTDHNFPPALRKNDELAT